MSFRIEEKLFIKPENLLQFREFLAQKSAKKIYSERTIQSLYFDNHKSIVYCFFNLPITLELTDI